MKLGGVEQTKENYRDRRGLPFLEFFLRDLRFAFRILRKSPGFTAVAVLTLAIGIGANTAIFSVVYAALLSPLPFPNPEQLVMVWSDRANGHRNTVSAADYLEWKRQNTVFASADLDSALFEYLDGDSEAASSVAFAYFGERFREHGWAYIEPLLDAAVPRRTARLLRRV